MKRIILTLLMLLASSPAWALSCSQVVVCTGGGCDYGKLSDAIAYLQLNCATLSAPAALKICGNSACDDTGSSSSDITVTAISGITTTTTNYLNIYTVGSARHNGTFSKAGMYKIAITAFDQTPIRVDKAPGIIVDGLAIDGSNESYRGKGIEIHGFEGENGGIIRNCIFKGIGGSESASAISIGDWGAFQVYNNIVYAGRGTGANLGGGISTSYPRNGVRIYNNTVSGSKYGVSLSNSTSTSYLHNNLFVGNTTDISGSFGSWDMDYNISTDSSATGIHSLTGKSASNQFVNTSSDLHIKLGSDAVNAGEDLSSYFTTDIDGDTRSGTWDIGADEYVSSGNPMQATFFDGMFLDGMTVN